jgi:RHS repeat-associated protein
MGTPTRWTFDGAGRMTKRERALTLGENEETFATAQVTEWTFDKNDRLTGHADDGSNDSTWTYDDLDRPVTMTYPDTSDVTYEYDDADNVLEVVDAMATTVENTYDDNNRLTARAVTRGSDVEGTTSETYTYDGLGRMLTAQDDDYKVSLTHAVIGLRSLVHSETQEFVGGSAYAKTLALGYDAVGNKTAETYPSGLDLDYGYSGIDLLTSISDGTYTIVSQTYWGRRLKGRTFQNGTTEARTYTGFMGEVAGIHHQTSDPTTVVDLDYGYDDNHDRLYEAFGGGNDGNAYVYDRLRRLTTAYQGSDDVTAPASNPYVTKIQYAMDDDGNRDEVVVTPYEDTPVTTGYTANTLNQYTAVGATSPTHDANGNLADDDTYQYLYDYRNQLVRVKEGSTTVVSYKYDALGRRVTKVLSSTDWERYFYSGLETIATYNYYNTHKQDFVYGQGIDEIVMLEQADVLDHDDDQDTSELTRHFYHRNALGSVLEITDALEATVCSYRYDPYGALTITVGGTPQGSDPLAQHWTFTGRFFDEETGFYYYRARMYDPATGRFLQRDPLGFSSGPTLHAYVECSPQVWVDPMGHELLVPGGMKYEPDPNDPDSETSTPTGEPEGEVKDLVIAAADAAGLVATFEPADDGWFRVRFKQRCTYGTRWSRFLRWLLENIANTPDKVTLSGVPATLAGGTTHGVPTPGTKHGGTATVTYSSMKGDPYRDRWSGVFRLVHELAHIWFHTDEEQTAVDAEDKVRDQLGFPEESKRKDYDNSGTPGRDQSGPGRDL